MTHDIVLGIPVCSHHDSTLLLRSLQRSKPGRACPSISYLIILDTPLEAGQLQNLEDGLAHVGPPCGVKIIAHNQQLGWVQSCNEILRVAVVQQKDALIVAPGAVIFPDTITELRMAAYSDAMIGFAAPRSNAGRICDLSLPQKASGDLADAAFTAFRSLRPRLPPVSYTPSVDGVCLFVKHRVLQNFGDFDLVSGRVNEENALIARANLHGYRAAIANRAFVFQPDRGFDAEAEFEDNPNADLMRERYPSYCLAVRGYFGSPKHKAVRLLAHLASVPSLPVAFDLTGFGRRKDGTSEYATNLIERFARLFAQKYELHGICDPSVWSHHGFDKIKGIARCPAQSDKLFAGVIRPGQPFDLSSVSLCFSRGAVTIVSLLDSIAYDCLHIRPPELSSLWSFVLRWADALIYPSEFSKAQFTLRFPLERGGEEVVSMPSTDIGEYADPLDHREEGYFLVVGNQFPHKGIGEIVHALRRALPNVKLKVLATRLSDLPDIESFESGALPAASVQRLYAGCKALIFPSHYEGFGFPVLHALGSKKVAFVRDLPVYSEIKSRVSVPQNIHAFGSDDELIKLLERGKMTWDDCRNPVEDVGWDRAARELEASLVRAIDAATLDKIEMRLEQLQLIETAVNGSQYQVSRLEERIKRFETSTSWKVTAPLRKLKSLLSRVRDGL